MSLQHSFRFHGTLGCIFIFFNNRLLALHCLGIGARAVAGEHADRSIVIILALLDSIIPGNTTGVVLYIVAHSARVGGTIVRTNSYTRRNAGSIRACNQFKTVAAAFQR